MKNIKYSHLPLTTIPLGEIEGGELLKFPKGDGTIYMKLKQGFEEQAICKVISLTSGQIHNFSVQHLAVPLEGALQVWKRLD